MRLIPVLPRLRPRGPGSSSGPPHAAAAPFLPIRSRHDPEHQDVVYNAIYQKKTPTGGPLFPAGRERWPGVPERTRAAGGFRLPAGRDRRSGMPKIWNAWANRCSRRASGFETGH